ncbi:hypothetical protein NECAME_06783 [Necator americanus]|uniref:Uncharacterized protein n=1 Tax=Necator americanus TaxID=51031 RepID=W2TS20_NECAM|nr:hypothetical protein NECAME_06783 [Necator americanus]ETN84623.1 hypothetical protein NECAME_06783 [Necator americanus]
MKTETNQDRSVPEERCKIPFRVGILPKVVPVGGGNRDSGDRPRTQRLFDANSDSDGSGDDRTAADGDGANRGGCLKVDRSRDEQPGSSRGRAPQQIFLCFPVQKLSPRRYTSCLPPMNSAEPFVTEFRNSIMDENVVLSVEDEMLSVDRNVNLITLWREKQRLPDAKSRLLIVDAKDKH